MHKSSEMVFAKRLLLSVFSLIFGIFLLPRLPVHFVGIFAIASFIFALFALWTSGLKQRIFGGILFSLPIIGVVLAFVMQEVDMQRSGAIYALSAEVVFLSFFLFLGLGIMLKKIK